MGEYKGLKVFPDRTVAVVSQDADGIAVKGYDMVALFATRKVLAGKAGFSASHLGATWLFASGANRDTFMKAPEEFMPEYGGYCSWSVANDSELPPSPGDPAAYDFVNGKLYLKFNKIVRFLWRLSSSKHIQKADARWPSFQETITDYLAGKKK